MDKLIKNVKRLYDLNEYELTGVPGHDGGRNLVYVCVREGKPEYVLRLSLIAPVSDVIPSANGNFVEPFYLDGRECYVMLFAYAKGMLISDNGYRYREGAPLEEYFYNTGKALGTIHRLSKEFKPVNRRSEFFDKYNREYIDAIIPDEYDALKKAIGERLDSYRNLPVDAGVYGLVHFDFSDGNYHIDMNNGNITVFDFDNCMYCWYMFDLANLWTHGTGWFQREPDHRGGDPECGRGAGHHRRDPVHYPRI